MDFTIFFYFFLNLLQTLGLFVSLRSFITLVPSSVTICVAEVITQTHSTLTAFSTHIHLLTQFNFAFRPVILILFTTILLARKSDPTRTTFLNLTSPRVTLHKGTLVGYEVKASSHIVYICHLPPMPLLPRLSP